MDNNKMNYAIFKSKDSRFDGKFFIGISTTKIYCRPICHAKLAKEENCSYFQTAALAEQSGYRPCLLCRPELAPGVLADQRSHTTIANKAAEMIQSNFNYDDKIEDIANTIGCSERHLRRVFKEEYGVSLHQFIVTQRLLFSKQLLTETNLKVIDVAMSSGFGSLRRFNDIFKKQYGLTPSDLRKRAVDIPSNQIIQLKLAYRPPYLYDEILSFLELRSIEGVELIKDNAYYRTVSLTNMYGLVVSGWIKVSHLPEDNSLLLATDESLLTILPQVIAKVKQLFDLKSEPNEIFDALKSMNSIDSSFCKKGTRLPGCFDAFEIVIRAVLGQQITVKAARTITNRIIQSYAVPIETNIEGLTHIFPSPASILSLGEDLASHLGPLGVIASRSQTIHELAKAFESNTLSLNSSAQPIEERTKLQQIKGIGEWTSGYIIMRAMQWPDIFLETDAAIKNAFLGKTSKEIAELAKEWAPWRSYALINIWNSL